MREERARQGLRSAFYASRLILFFCVLTTATLPAACRSGGIQVGSWEEAVLYAQEALAEAGDLEGRLEHYAGLAGRLGANMEAVERARPAAEAVGQLHGVNVPLIGDGWEILLVLVSMATLDGARVLGRLEATLTGLVRMKNGLDGLAGLGTVAAAARTFRAEPNPRTLSALSDGSLAATPDMRRVYEDLSNLLEPLADVAGDLNSLSGGLAQAASAGVPVVSEAARRAQEEIAPVEGPLQELHGTLEELHGDLGADLMLLESLQEAVRQARQRDA
jgi:hypothetical protein